MASPIGIVDATGLSDEEIVQGVLAGETALFEVLMRRYNQRLFRTTRAIVRDDAEAEDVTQDAYVRAYQHLYQFEGRARFSTWLMRIAINEAMARARRNARREEIDAMEENRKESLAAFSLNENTPEQRASAAETRTLLEQAIDSLPDSYREVFVLRDVEEMSTAETAESLNLTEENVKTRLHRARALLRRELYTRAGATSSTAFQFLGARCDRLVRNVMNRIGSLPLPGGNATQHRIH